MVHQLLGIEDPEVMGIWELLATDDPELLDASVRRNVGSEVLEDIRLSGLKDLSS